METVNEILFQQQPRRLLSAWPEETVLAATQRMVENGVGALLIMDGERLVGIFTERDVLRRVVAEERLPSEVRVGDVMSGDVACCTRDTSIDEVENLMRQQRIRHIPVVDEIGTVTGILSIGDVNAYRTSKQEVQIGYLHEHIYGRV